MSNGWLSDRIEELDKDSRNPEFALLGTIHWMRSLSILCGSEQFKNALAKRYQNIYPKENIDLKNQMDTLSQILMGSHFLAALKKMKTNNSNDAAALTRSAIISWYYGIYHSAKGMLAINDGDVIENHEMNANKWDNKLCQSGLIISPFDYRFPSLTKKSINETMLELSGTNKYDNRIPNDESAAKACCFAYLNGTSNWQRKKREKKIINHKKFKSNFKDFRKKEAQEYRDRILKGEACGFLHEAIRYRGKANYRDVLFLSYGHSDSRFPQLIDDLDIVLSAFIKMVMAYSSRRLGEVTWNLFLNDIDSNSHLKELFVILRMENIEF